jgi:hypothetical protein
MTFVRGIIWIVVALLIAGALVAASKPVYAVVWLAVCLVATSLFHFYHLHALHRWSMLPRQRQLPMGIGGWRTVLDRLGRFTRQERRSGTRRPSNSSACMRRSISCRMRWW